MPPQRILVVEDEVGWVELLKIWFKMADFANVRYAETGARALELAIAEPPDCILLDLVLPDQSGMELCQKLRALPALARVPVVLFTGHSRERVLGLQNGADYFVGKSERPHELLATLDAAFRRREAEEGVLRKGDLSLRANDREVRWRGELVAKLSPKMFVLFHVLVERSPQPVARGDLYRLVEGVENPGLSRALDVMLNRLRKMLPDELKKRIVNVKNFGYVFVDPAQAPAPQKTP
ncbi:MAG: response regulator transcription factor [Elusimicrobia bacterium]|nr:response regulator transcription factor [Elusimicrobiota bacterium]